MTNVSGNASEIATEATIHGASSTIEAAELGPDLAAVRAAEHALDDVAAGEREDAARRADERERDPRRGDDVPRAALAGSSPIARAARTSRAPSDPAVTVTSADAPMYA